MIYLKEFIRNPIKTGAIAPSSASLAKLITKTANLKNTKSVVELGTGNGIFTEKILSRISPDCNFSSIEINANFVEKTRKRCPDAKVYHDSAENLKKYLATYNNQKCDCIISGLPWATFDKNSQNKLLNTVIDSLEENGIFLTFAYIQGLLLPNGKYFKNLLLRNFSTVKKTKIVWQNLPPAFVYYCKK